MLRQVCLSFHPLQTCFKPSLLKHLPPNFGGVGPVGPTATPVQNAAGAPGDYFQPGPPSLSYLPNF